MLTNIPANEFFDLPVWMGQRSSSFRFHLTNGLTGENLGDITPLRGAVLTHDTSRTIKRQLNISLGRADTAAINPITDRINPYFVESTGTEWPLGQYMFTDQSKSLFTSGDLSSVILNDEMFLVDQQITAGIDATGIGCTEGIKRTLAGLPVRYELEPSNFTITQAWGLGTSRGSILESLSIVGDYFSPWFGNDGQMHFIRTFNPADVVPDFDYDSSNQVFRSGIVETSELLNAPNRFVVISNLPANDPREEIVATADIPPTAPHSIANRGFVIAEVRTLQLTDAGQAIAVAQGLANRHTVFETTTLTTAADPRHDSYNVIKWQGSLWLELAWSMSLTEGAGMTSRLRKAYGQ